MKLILPKTAIVTLNCLFVLLVMVDSAFAHRVNVFAWVDGDTIHVESKFSGGKRVKAGKVVVVDPQGVELLTGLTNDQGEYSFQVPKQSDLRIILIAGQGHQGEWTVLEDELQGPSPGTKTETDTLTIVTPDQKNIVDKPSVDSESAMSGNGIKPEELETIIENVLDRKLRPVTRMLAEMQQKEPGVRDIFAGIGYIIGLVGIAAYVQNRKKKG